jgi:hypothetical protein
VTVSDVQPHMEILHDRFSLRVLMIFLGQFFEMKAFDPRVYFLFYKIQQAFLCH